MAANYIEGIFMILTFVYSIFLPLRLGTIWFYIGLPIAIVGAVTFAITIVSFATNPIGNGPVTTRPYRYSRHPMYVTQLIMFIGVSIASASWLFLLLIVGYRTLSFIYAGSEEHICLEKYGEVYREYMNRTPRWIGVPKLR